MENEYVKSTYSVRNRRSLNKVRCQCIANWESANQIEYYEMDGYGNVISGNFASLNYYFYILSPTETNQLPKSSAF